jgi:hypothetical protein
MAGFIFTFGILSILIAAGFLFAWAVRLASTKNKPVHQEHPLIVEPTTHKP